MNTAILPGERLKACPFCSAKVEYANVPTATTPIMHHPDGDRYCPVAGRFFLARDWNTRAADKGGEVVSGCMACEGKPKGENDPCMVCGTHSAPIPANLGDALAALRECHDTLHECTAVLTANDCAKVAAVMERARDILTLYREGKPA